jgi:ABC-type oligopeptide transport system ATPase subunit
LFDIIPSETKEFFLFSITRALSATKYPEVIGPLKEIKKKFAKQEHPYVDRLIKKVQKASSAEEEVKKLRKEFDSLKKSLKKLKESVETLDFKVNNPKKTEEKKE